MYYLCQKKRTLGESNKEEKKKRQWMEKKSNDKLI